MKAFFAPALTVFMAMCGSAGAQQVLSGAEIQALLKNKRVSLACVDGSHGSGTYTMARNFGTIRGRYSAANAPPVSDTGTVQAQGNDLCVQFQKLNGGNQTCFAVSQTGRGQFAFSAFGIKACALKVI